MCGICGVLTFRDVTSVEETQEKKVRAALARMRSRGPDAEQVYRKASVILGHRRLAIIDVDHRADQPMPSRDGRYVIVFNGEIYNYRELRAELEAEGVSFSTNSDTEVLLEFYARHGVKTLSRLRGMFAFAIWDQAEKKLFLARDPYGIKPLYYAVDRDGFYFASTVKALQAMGLGREPDTLGWMGFFMWGSVPEPLTVAAGVRALPAGHWMTVGTAQQEPAIVLYHDIRKAWQTEVAELPPEELRSRVQEAVRESVRYHTVADVPVGVFLSGGVDSSVVAALMVELGMQVEGVTLGFSEFDGQPQDEVPYARLVAEQYGFRHHVRTVTRSEFEADLPDILDAMDQPSVDGFNTWYAAKAAAERGYKVVLSGVGGDELFAGYRSFHEIPNYHRRWRKIQSFPLQEPVAAMILAVLGKIKRRPFYGAIGEHGASLDGWYFLRKGVYLPSEIVEFFAHSPPPTEADVRDLIHSIDFGTVRCDVKAMGMRESVRYLGNQLLRDSDWASMAHSLELRTPLVDAGLLHSLAPYVSQFAQGMGKSLLAQAPLQAIPGAVRNRPKMGFATPMGRWIDDMIAQSSLPPAAKKGAFERRLVYWIYSNWHK